MKIKLLVLALIVFGFTLIPFKAEAVDTSASFGIDYMSQYVWRGTQLSDEAFVLQPSVTATYGPVSMNLWASYDTETRTNTETDLTLSYARTMDDVSIDVGYIYYSLAGAGIDDTAEVYVSVGYDTFLSPNVTLYVDIEQDTAGSFAVASIGHDLEVSGDITVSLGASASVNFDNEFALGVDSDGEAFTALYNGEVSASVPFALPMDENIVITPMIAYSFALSDDAETALEGLDADGDESSVLYGGVGISVGF